MANELEKLKNILESFPGGNEKTSSLTWGSFVKQPDSRGVISVNGNIFFYAVDERCQPLFTGPMTLKEAIGYIGTAELGLDVREYTLDIMEILEISNRMSYSLEEVDIIVKKTCLRDKKE